MAENPTRQPPGAPGVISMFFVAKAALFGAAAWAWLLYLISRDNRVTGWQLFAACAGICFTLVAVLLGVRYAGERAAALRHAELVREVAELSWQAVAAAPAEAGTPVARIFTIPNGQDRNRR